MAYFNFSGLIKKYGSEFTVITAGERVENDMGDYEYTAPTETAMRGAIISLKEDKIFRSDGALTEKDRQLFMLEPLQKCLIGSTVVYKDNKYTVQNAVDNSEFTGVYAYLLKWVSVFGGDRNA